MRSTRLFRRSEGAVETLRRSIGPAPSARLRAELARPDFPWAGFAEAANRFLLTPAMPWRLEAHGVLDLVPADLREYFEAAAVISAGKADDGLAQIGRVAAILNAAGIRPMAVKSTAGLIENLYPRPGCRIMSDLDLLVPEGRVEHVAAALEGTGYRALPERLDRWRNAPAGSLRHYPRLFHERETWGVEVHARLLDGPCRDVLRTGELFERGREIEWRGSRLVLPSLPDQIAHTVLHATEWMETWTTHGTQPVRRLMDLALLFERLGASDRWLLAETVRRGGWSWRMNLCLAFVEVWLGVEAPAEFRSRAADRWQQKIFRTHARLALKPGPTVLRQATGRLLRAWNAPGRVRFLEPSRYVVALRRLAKDAASLRG